MKQVVLAAKKSIFATLVAGTLSASVSPAHATGTPVFDLSNLIQNAMTALEASTQTETQINQYETILTQALAPASGDYSWDTSSINRLLNTIDTLGDYARQLGGIDNYLGKFQDADHYRRSGCFTAAGCSPAERAAMEQSRSLASQSRKRANDAMSRGLDQQQLNLRDEADSLETLQARAETAEGQMEALAYSNQFASKQADQLMDIRALLIAKQNAEAARMHAELDQEAVQTAAAAQLRRGSYRPSPARNW
ncbi:MAG TPA: P-type conjugative transfer protein TrbJ [Anaerolineae bacterium]|nr:P-type conjugative transfer protein TrbJ [Anaerolineae bacterium]